MSQLIGILNPRRRRKSKSRRRRARAHSFPPVKRHRRRRRRNGVGALLLNPRRGGGGGVMSAAKSAAPAILGTTGGLIGTRWLAGFAGQYVGGGSPIVNVGLRAGIALGGYMLLRKFAPRAAMPFLIGGGIATLEAAAQTFAPDFAASVGLGYIQPAGMGELIGSGGGLVGGYGGGLGYIQPAGLSGLGCADLASA